MPKLTPRTTSRTTPKSPPRVPQRQRLHSASPDGGVAQHPVHDEPEEDFTPRDYERQIDEVADELRAKARRAGVTGTDKVSEER
jgi:hypothetical protein